MYSVLKVTIITVGSVHKLYYMQSKQFFGLLFFLIVLRVNVCFHVTLDSDSNGFTWVIRAVLEMVVIFCHRCQSLAALINWEDIMSDAMS